MRGARQERRESWLGMKKSGDSKRYGSSASKVSAMQYAIYVDRFHASKT